MPNHFFAIVLLCAPLLLPAIGLLLPLLSLRLLLPLLPLCCFCTLLLLLLLLLNSC
jgi:hypothetical protein